MPVPPNSPTNSAALSLLELRRHLLPRAGALSAKARDLRDRGAGRSAAKVAEESERLRDVARTVRMPESRD